MMHMPRLAEHLSPSNRSHRPRSFLDAQGHLETACILEASLCHPFNPPLISYPTMRVTTVTSFLTHFTLAFSRVEWQYIGMGLREDLQRRIDRKSEETKELRVKIRENEAYIQGLIDTLKTLPRETSGGSGGEVSLKPGTDLALARDVIRGAGHPLHVADILKALEKPATRMNRASLSGNLAAYVRKGEVFTRPAPNTFGLLEFKSPAKADVKPPDGFGKAEEEPSGGFGPHEDVPF
jgi:hypothetical protein